MLMRSVFRRGVLGLGVILVASQGSEAREPKVLTNEAVRAKLEAKVPMDFPKGTYLDDVLKYVTACTMGATDDGILINLDPEGMKKAGATRESAVSISVKGVPLKTSLEQLLKPLGLTYVVKDGGLTITAPPEKDRAKEGEPKP